MVRSTPNRVVQVRVLGAVSRSPETLRDHFRVSQFPLYLKNGEGLICQNSQLFFFLFP